MTRNRNLVPTQITDKNGKLTTVHRSPERSSAIGNTIPAPSAAPSVNMLKQTLNLIMDNCTRVPPMGSSIINRETIVNDLRALREDTVVSIYEYLSQSRYPETSVHFVHLLKNRAADEDINKFIISCAAVDENKEMSRYEILGLGHGAFDSLAMDPAVEDISGDTRRRVEALVKVASHIYMELPSDDAAPWIRESTRPEHEAGIRIINENLRSLVLEYPDRADDMVRFMQDRGTADPVTMREYLENGTALAEGIL